MKGRQRWLLRCLALTLGLALAAGAAEVAVRVATRTDGDGNLRLGKRRLRPYRLPVASVRDTIAEYEARRGKSYIRYDGDLGWSPRPGASSQSGLYHANRAGYRGAAPGDLGAAVESHAGVLRIALFGDSFTHGDGVAFAETWGEILRERLAEHRAVEVLNFGVGAYGMDQAFLRWKRDGRRYRPHVVLFGFMIADAQRNLNLVRALTGSGIPFTKPRFVREDGNLRLVNQPTVPLHEIVDRLASFEDWKHWRRESFYEPDDYAAHWWSSSRLLAYLQASFWRDRRVDKYAPGTEAYELALSIVDAFRDDVVAGGARFAVVHLPDRRGIRYARESKPLRHQALFDELAKRNEMLDPQTALGEAASAIGGESAWSERLLAEDGHYSREGNRIVAEVIVEAIAEWPARSER